MTMNLFLKCAGFCGVAAGVLVFLKIVLETVFKFNPVPDELMVAVLGSGAIVFCGCLILALNEISANLRKAHDRD